MKKILFILALMISTIALGQEQTNETIKSKSKSVEFMEKEGSFLKKEFYKLGKVKGVECEVLIMTDLVENTKVGCLRLITSRISGPQYVGTLDSDELAAATQCLEYIKEQVLPTKSDVYTEYMYLSRDDVKLGVYSEFINGYVNNDMRWRIFVQTRIWLDSKEYFNAKHLDKLIEYLKQAKQMIEDKTK